MMMMMIIIIIIIKGNLEMTSSEVGFTCMWVQTSQNLPIIIASEDVLVLCGFR